MLLNWVFVLAQVDTSISNYQREGLLVLFYFLWITYNNCLYNQSMSLTLVVLRQWCCWFRINTVLTVNKETSKQIIKYHVIYLLWSMNLSTRTGAHIKKNSSLREIIHFNIKEVTINTVGILLQNILDNSQPTNLPSQACKRLFSLRNRGAIKVQNCYWHYYLYSLFLN